MVTEQTIEQYLQDLSIAYERLEDRLWRTGFRGDVRDIDMQIRLVDSVLIVISPFVNAPRKNRTAIYRRLLELNMDVMLGKFGMWWKCSLYEDAARVPVIAAGPHFPRGARVRTPVSLLDVQAALFKCIGARRPLAWHGTPLQELPPNDDGRVVFA
ncbi:MAG: YbjN domain-containing protein, partial [Armatimonadota bacterium]|nr:YbjN domain-containing protein [Armatimonadota bacterium]